MSPDPPLFEARTAPPNSLAPREACVLAWLLGGVSAAMGLLFALAGAWPVLVFVGAEVMLVLGLLALSRRAAARDAEWVTVQDGRVRVRRREGRRVEALELDAFWARLAREQGRLLLGHRGRRIEVGRFLGPDERAAFGEALEAALHRARRPIFDNPQLR